MGRDHPGHPAGVHLAAGGGRRRRRSSPLPARAELLDAAAGLLAAAERPVILAGGGVGAPARRPSSPPWRRRSRAPVGVHPGRQGRLRLGPSAVRAVVGGGRGHHRAAGWRRRLAGDRLVHGRGDQQLLHLAAARPGHPDRCRAAGAGVQRGGVGHPRRRQARARRAGSRVDPPAGRRAGRADGRHTARPGARPARRSGRGPRAGCTGRRSARRCRRRRHLLGHDDRRLLGLVVLGRPRQGRSTPPKGPVGSVGRTAPGWVARSGLAGGYWP